MLVIRSSLFVSLTLLLHACGNSPVTTDAGPIDLAPTGADLLATGDLAIADFASNDGGACNSLVNAAPIVQQVVVNQPMPSATTGGTITPGTYYLTDSKIYQGAPPGVIPLQYQETQLVSGVIVQTVGHIVGGPSASHDTRTYSESGTILTITFTCGGSATGTIGYDVTGTGYTTYNNVAKTVNVWTHQ